MAFTGINFTQFVTDVKGTVSTFSYVNPVNWFSFEQGVFPDSLKGNTFTIKLASLTTHEEVEDWSILETSVEFLLNGIHDGYLAKVDDCMEAVRQMSSNVTETAGNTQIQLQNVEDQKDFSIDYVGELVAVTFGVSWIVDNRTSTEIS
jgi:hypothetical protein